MVKKKLSMPIKIGLIIGALLLAVILIIIVCKCCREHYDNQNTIFVSIASYRDKQCHGTIKDLYDKAKYPKNIHVCVCDQWKEKDELCGTIKKYKDNITTLKLASTEAKGPVYARALINTHYHDEKYFLMIDSHSKFDKDWDVNLISQIKELQKKSFHPHAKYSHSLPYPRQDKDKVVITSYVKDYKDRNNDLNFQLCKTINSSDFPAQFDSVAKRNKDKFKQQELKKFLSELKIDHELTPEEKFELYYEEYRRQKDEKEGKTLSSLLKSLGIKKPPPGKQTPRK